MKVKRKRITFLGRRSGRPDRKVTFYVRPRPSDKDRWSDLIVTRALAVLVAIVYAAFVGWMAALGETLFAYYGGLLTICTYAAVVYLTILRRKRLKGVKASPRNEELEARR